MHKVPCSRRTLFLETQAAPCVELALRAALRALRHRTLCDAGGHFGPRDAEAWVHPTVCQCPQSVVLLPAA